MPQRKFTTQKGTTLENTALRTNQKSHDTITALQITPHLANDFSWATNATEHHIKMPLSIAE